MEKKFITTIENLIEGDEYFIKCVVSKIDREGEQDKKRPINISVQLEESKIFLKMCSWDYGLLDIFKKAIDDHKICVISFKTSKYKDSLNFKILSFEETDEDSKLEKLFDSNSKESSLDTDLIKNNITNLINMVKNDNYKKILTKLILEDEKFFVWRAAKANHHAFNGGLALHSYNVCNDAVCIANNYYNESTFAIDYDLLITGALLHDIGKIEEYAPNGDFSFEGQLLSHIVIGIEKVDDCCRKLDLDPFDREFVKLKHIIAAHHGKREFGSPNTPTLTEAYIVSEADMTDARMEAIYENISFMNPGDVSQSIKCLDGGNIMKI